MKGAIKRFRVWLARVLTNNTNCAVVRRDHVRGLRQSTEMLYDYVARSGGLQDPRRIKAYRRSLRASLEIRNQADEMLVQ